MQFNESIATKYGARKLYDAVFDSRNIASVKKCLDEGVDINEPDRYGESSLHLGYTRWFCARRLHKHGFGSVMLASESVLVIICACECFGLTKRSNFFYKNSLCACE